MLSSLAIKRPVATAMLTLMVAIVGLSSLLGLPRDLLPKIELPFGLVMVSYTNASPEEVETMITKPLEGALAAVENLDMIQSMTLQGQSIVVVQFKFGTDMNFATLDMREKIANVKAYLPSEAGEPMVMKLDLNATPIIQIYVSGDMPLYRLNQEIDDNVLTYFERATGVASVSLQGGVQEEISVKVDAEKLAGYNMALAQIGQILAAENINLPSGDISKGSTEVIVRTIGQFDSVDEIKNLPVMLADRSIVRLSEIASIARGYKDQTSVTRINGSSAIGIMVTKQSDANTVAVSDAIRKVVADMQEKYPDLSFTVGLDQADYIRDSIASVTEAAVLGAILAVVVVFFFLRNFKTTLVIAISIPVSLLATFALMNLQHITLNLITLCALTLAVGMLVDDSIIVLENIFRKRQQVSSADEAAAKGSQEIFLAVLAATITKILVFLPIALSDGIASLMFKDFCFTIIIALLASLVISLTVVPMLCSKLLTQGISTSYIRFGTHRHKFKHIQKFAQFIDYLGEQYEVIVGAALKRKKRVIFSCIAVFLVSMMLVAVVGTELLPSTDEGALTISIDMPYGTSLEEKDEFMTVIESYVLAIPELENCTLAIGGGGLFSIGSTSSTLNVSLVSQADRKRSVSDIVKDLKEQTKDLTGADISIEASSSTGMMFGGGVDMSLMIKGPEFETLERIGKDLSLLIQDMPEVADASLDVTEGNPELRVIIDRNVAANYGITAYQLANGLSSSLAGTTATKLKVNGTEIDVRLSLSNTYSESVDNMKQIMITGAMGLPVPVGQIAEFEFDNSPSSITHDNQQRLTTINIDIESKDLNSASKQIVALVNDYAFPDGYFYESAGSQQEMMDSFRTLLLALAVAIALVYLWLAAQFESLLLPFIITMAIPFAMSGAFIALFITGTKLSMVSFLGLIILVGIVINNSILLVEFIAQNKKVMARDEALIQAGKVRLRPILMTSLATCAGMIPLAVGFGEGSEMLSPMAITIIGGLVASTIVTLIFIPVLYAIIDDGKIKRTDKKEAKRARIAELEARWLEEDAKVGK